MLFLFFLCRVALGRAVADAGQDYAAWYAADPAAIEAIAAEYLA